MAEQNAQDTYDVVVIGAGPVGENVAQYAIEGTDLTAVLVEKELVGGECSYYACMPSKALLRPLEVVGTSRNIGGVEPAGLDNAGLEKRRDSFTSNYDDSGQVEWAKSENIEVVRGAGRIVGEREVEVTDGGATRRIRARKAVIIATGSTAVIPDPYADVIPWTSRDATSVVDVPESIVIVGGGVVAVEAATWLAGMGAQVTMLVRGDSLLAGREPFAGEFVAESLRGAGVEIRFNTEATAVSREHAEFTGYGHIHGGPVHIETPDGTLDADEVLVATGRKPALEGLGLDSVGLTADDITEGNLPDWLYAVGDASGDAPLTHWGKYRARVIGAQIRNGALGEEQEPEVDDVPVPQVVFTAPEVVAVGLTEAEAKDAGLETVTAEYDYPGVAGASLVRDDQTGRAKIVVNAKTGTLVGATFVGYGVTELLQSATVAIVGEVPVWKLRHAVPAYPTGAEVWLRLLEKLPREFRCMLV